jgi:ankyrin repeat protein
MWSVYGDSGYMGFTERILKAGVDVNAKNDQGDTALSLAVRFGNMAAARKLTEAGVSYDTLVREGVRKALAVLQPSGVRFFKNSGCVSCHHQNLPAMAVAAVRAHSIPVDETIADEQLRAVLAVWQPKRDNLAGTADPSDSIPYSLLGLAASRYPADDTVRAMVRYLE